MHFLHISQYGYIYEHSIAFFPFYPLCISQLTNLLSNILIMIPHQYDTLLLLNSVVLNFIFSLITTVYLYKLTNLIFNNNNQLTTLTVILFCLNPATIFFIAPYSESLYFMLTTCALYNLHKNCLFKSLKKRYYLKRIILNENIKEINYCN